MLNTHSVVYSVDPSTRSITNLNRSLLNLDEMFSYTISEYIEDRAGEGASVLSREGDLFRFSDGTAEVLIQQVERFDRSHLSGVAYA